MPLLNDAKTCYVGTQPITKIYAGTELVWPKVPEVPDYIFNNNYMWKADGEVPDEPPLYDRFGLGGPVLPLLSDWSPDSGLCVDCLADYTIRIGITYDGVYENVNWFDPGWIELHVHCSKVNPGGYPNVIISPESKQIYVYVYVDNYPNTVYDDRWYEVRYQGVLITSERGWRDSAKRIPLPDGCVSNPCTPP